MRVEDVPLAYRGMTVDDDMADQSVARPQPDVRADRAERPNLDVVAELGVRVHHS